MLPNLKHALGPESVAPPFSGRFSSDNSIVSLRRASEPYSKSRDTIVGDYDHIVVGGGIGGLVAGSLLALGGKKPIVLERHGVVGGFSHVYKRFGQVCSAGVSYVGHDVVDRMNPLSWILDAATAKRLSWRPMAASYDVFHFGEETRSVPVLAGALAYRDDLQRRYPEFKKAIAKYFRAVRLANAAFVPFLLANFMERLPLGMFPANILRFPFLRYAGKTTASILSDLGIGDGNLAAELTGQLADYGLPPRQSSFGAHALVVQHYWNGAVYPEGGVGNIPESLSRAIRERGGRVVSDAEVAKILVKEGRAVGVALSDGKILEASDGVVSDVGFVTTRKLLAAGDVGTETRTSDKISSSAHVVVNFIFDKSDKALGFTAQNIHYFPYGRDHDAAWRAFQANAGQPDYFQNKPPVIYLSFSTAKGGGSDKALVEVVIPALSGAYEKWRSLSDAERRNDLDYQRLKQAHARFALDALRKFCPDVSDEDVARFQGLSAYEPLAELDVKRKVDVATPITTERFVPNAIGGAIYGVALSLSRYVDRELTTPYHAGVEKLFMAGADALNPGVGGTTMSGFFAAVASLGFMGSIKLVYAILSEVKKDQAGGNPDERENS